MARKRNKLKSALAYSKTSFVVLIAVETLLVAGYIKGMPAGLMLGGMAVCMVLTVYINIFQNKLMSTVEDGMNLLKAQDYASRLTKVGHPEADTIVTLFNDMMDTLKAERLGKEEKNLFLQQLIDASAQGIVIMDLDGAVMQTNAAADAMLAEIEIPELEDNTSATLHTASDMIYRVIRQSFFDRGFRRTFYLIETLTEEVRAIERNTYGKVIRTIAHEVNNTLGGIDSVLQVVKEVSDPDIAEVVENCRERSGKLTDFISNYASLVKLPEPHLMETDLAESIEHLKPFISCYAEQADIKIEYRLDSGSTVYIDPVLWEQAIINIIKNSVESIAETGRTDGVIEIATDRFGQLTITDNGTGISDDQSARLHTPFYTTKANGQGIGMMLIREILRRHKCKFTLLTEKSTKKTTFRVFFPVEC